MPGPLACWASLSLRLYYKALLFAPRLSYIPQRRPTLSLTLRLTCLSVAAMALRPILKPLPHSYHDSPLPFASSSRIPPLDSPHVHFPPTPVMTKISITHSPFSYDRAPIQVSPNVCALPERGERKVGGVMPMKGGEGGYFHPSAYKSESMLCASDHPNNPRTPPIHRSQSSSSSERDGHLYPYLSPHLAPPLVYDHSSESDSDLCGSPPSLDNEAIGESAPHVSVHLSGFSMSPSISTSSGISSMHRKKSKSHRHTHAKRDSNEGVLGHVGGMDMPNRSHSRIRRVLDCTGDNADDSGASGFSSSFSDPDLEGCLGGF